MGDLPVVHTSGGAGGIVANRDVILGLADLYGNAYTYLSEVWMDVGAALRGTGNTLLFDEMGLSPALGAGAGAQVDAAHALGAAATLLEHALRRAERLRFNLVLAVLGYRWGADLSDLIGPSVWDQVTGFVEGTAQFTWGIVSDGPAAGSQRYLVQHPGAVDKLVNDGEPFLLLTPAAPTVLEFEAYRAVVEALDGSGHAEPRGTVASGAAPRSLADLASDLAVRDTGPGGSIDVQIITGADGSRHVVVDVTGIDTAIPTPPGTDVADLTTGARAIDGKPTAYEQGVFDAMRQAGVRPGDPVLIVGHSLGGMIAVNAARTAARTGRYNVTHVVTEGAPIGRTVGRLPARVQVLAIENSHDIVPHLDGRSNPDRRNVVTVTGAAGDGRTVTGDHDSRTVYVPLARASDATKDISVRAFLRGAHGFLSGSSATTYSFQVVRS